MAETGFKAVHPALRSGAPSCRPSHAPNQENHYWHQNRKSKEQTGALARRIDTGWTDRTANMSGCPEFRPIRRRRIIVICRLLVRPSGVEPEPKPGLRVVI